MATFYCDSALLPDGWADNVVIDADAAGNITAVEAGTPRGGGGIHLPGAVVPGMPNLHSHAFQRAMAGLGEIAGPSEDSFWTWRKVMYEFLGKLTPEDVQAIAAQVYLDMIRSGYTSVGEFHYVHHAPDGTPYDTLTELSDRAIAAARQVGLAITHLPVLYAYGGFGGQAAVEGQRRFLNDGARFLRLIDDLAGSYGADPQVCVGIAPHSLRAVTRPLLNDVLVEADRLVPSSPVHIHIAEQTKEVDDCVAWSGVRPVAWLFDNFDVSERWCLVHATHMDDSETSRLAHSGAVAGLCPTTEANLGDGFFPACDYHAAGGAWGIGSDSHIAVSVSDELRTYEYGQRLLHRRRNVLNGVEGRSTGAALFNASVAGGAQALGRHTGLLAPGYRADFVALDISLPALAGRAGDQLLDAWIFASQEGVVCDVVCGGRHVLKDRHHANEAEIAGAFTATMQKLLG